MSYLSSIGDFLRKKSNPRTPDIPIDFFKVHVLKLENNLAKLTEVAAGSDYDFNEFEEKVYKLEIVLNECTEEASQTDLFWKIEELKESLNDLKKETDFFEKEDELDLGSPNLDENDFDEESIESDSPFEDNYY